MQIKTLSQTLVACLLLTLGFVAACGKSKPVPVAVSQSPVAEVADPEVASAAEPAVKQPAGETPQPESSEPESSQGKEEAVESKLGTLKLRFEYEAEAFEPEKLNVANVAFCGQFPLVNERLLVHPNNKGIKNVVVYVYTGRGGSKLPVMPARKSVVTLANQNCRFEPHIVLTQVGDTLKVTNPDQVGHNANLSFFNNKAENLLIPPGQQALVDLPLDEPAPIPVDCNIHPWMKSYVLVLSHPFAAASDENGDLTITGLPAGQPLVFRAFHEAGAINTVTINGQQSEWKRSRFELQIEPGLNDLGTVVLPAAAF
jgi:plastocyanin